MLDGQAEQPAQDDGPASVWLELATGVLGLLLVLVPLGCGLWWTLGGR